MVALLFDAAGWAAIRCCSSDCSPSGALGFLAVGSLFSAMLVRARSRDVLLPVLLYPMTVPVMIAGVRGTAALLETGAGPADGTLVAVDARVLRRRLPDAGVVDVRTGDVGVRVTAGLKPRPTET